MKKENIEIKNQNTSIKKENNLIKKHQMDLEKRIKKSCKKLIMKKYIVFFVTLAAQVNFAQNIFPSEGNVGIGTTNPAQKLDVNGSGIFYGGITSSLSDVIGGYIKIKNPSKTSNGSASEWTIFNMSGGYGNSLQFWAYDNLGCAGGMCSNRFTIMDNGNVGIGTTNPTSMLTVAGNINSREVKVTVDAGADFVFENNYNLPSLDAVDKFIKENKHLPEIASADEMKKEGINLSEMNIKLLQKIEEMTLYMIEQNKKIIDLENRLKKVENN